MWDAGIWSMRYRGYSWKQLIDVLKREGADSDHGLLVDAEIARRMEVKAVERQASE